MPALKYANHPLWPLLCAILLLSACSGKEALPLGDTGRTFNEFRDTWNKNAEAAGLPQIPGKRSAESVLGGGNMKNTYKMAEGLALDVWWTRKDKELALSSLSLRIAADGNLMREYGPKGAKLLAESVLAGREHDGAAIVEQMGLDILMERGVGQGPAVKLPGLEFAAWLNKSWGLNISCSFK